MFLKYSVFSRSILLWHSNWTPSYTWSRILYTSMLTLYSSSEWPHVCRTSVRRYCPIQIPTPIIQHPWFNLVLCLGSISIHPKSELTISLGHLEWQSTPDPHSRKKYPDYGTWQACVRTCALQIKSLPIPQNLFFFFLLVGYICVSRLLLPDPWSVNDAPGSRRTFK